MNVKRIADNNITKISLLSAVAMFALTEISTINSKIDDIEDEMAALTLKYCRHSKQCTGDK